MRVVATSAVLAGGGVEEVLLDDADVVVVHDSQYCDEEDVEEYTASATLDCRSVVADWIRSTSRQKFARTDVPNATFADLPAAGGLALSINHHGHVERWNGSCRVFGLRLQYGRQQNTFHFHGHSDT